MFTTMFELKTERLCLRLVTTNDAEAVYNLFSDERIMEPYGMFSLASKEAAITFTEKLIQEEEIVIVYDKKIIGSLGFVDVNERNKRLEVAYTLLPEYWSHGFMTEALKSICDYVFTHTDFIRIESFVYPQNIGSQKVLEKAGFLLEGHLRKRSFARDAFHDHLIYGRLKPNL